MGRRICPFAPEKERELVCGQAHPACFEMAAYRTFYEWFHILFQYHLPYPHRYWEQRLAEHLFVVPEKLVFDHSKALECDHLHLVYFELEVFHTCDEL